MTDNIYNERWKPILGYEGMYEISDHGRVKSLDRFDGRGRWIKGRIMTPTVNKSGYYHVDLCKDGKRTCSKVHRLVARAFCEGYAPGLLVCHNDGNPLNNHYTNVRFDTPAGNMADKVKHGTSSGAIGEQVNTSKLTVSKVISIIDDLNTGMTGLELAKKHNVYPSTINRIKLGKTWRHITKDHPITI